MGYFCAGITEFTFLNVASSPIQTVDLAPPDI
jgi:hypothetical protein